MSKTIEHSASTHVFHAADGKRYSIQTFKVNDQEYEVLRPISKWHHAGLDLFQTVTLATERGTRMLSQEDVDDLCRSGVQSEFSGHFGRKDWFFLKFYGPIAKELFFPDSAPAKSDFCKSTRHAPMAVFKSGPFEIETLARGEMGVV
jgi:hypothetical protein